MPLKKAGWKMMLRASKSRFLICCLLITVLGLGLGQICFFSEKAVGVDQPRNISVYVRELKVDFADQLPEIIDGRTMVPLRAVFEHPYVQAQVAWKAETQSVVAVDRTGRTLLFEIGKNNYYVIENGVRKERKSDVAPIIINGRTLLPLRALAESLDFNVQWIDAESKVLITEKPGNTGSNRMLMSPEDWEAFLHPASSDGCAPSG